MNSDIWNEVNAEKKFEVTANKMITALQDRKYHIRNITYEQQFMEPGSGIFM